MLTTDPVTVIPFIGEKQAENFAKLNIFTLKDLLYHIPRFYKDTSELSTLTELNRDEEHTVIVKLLSIKNIRLRSGKFIQKAIVSDNTAEVGVTWFNQPFLTKNLRVGNMLYLSGRLDPKGRKPVFISPDYEIVKEKNLHLGRIVPVYNLTKGITIKWLRTRLNDLTSNISSITDLVDKLPQEIKHQFDLIGLQLALKDIHFPNSEDEIIASRKRLAFDELLEIYQILIKERQKRLHAIAPKILPFDIEDKNIRVLIKSLPFNLTSTQKVALNEIYKDYKKPYPLHRLLQGDVGSGKTIIALLSAIPVMNSDLQVVFLAPTSVLAKQHYETIISLLKRQYKIILLTASSKIKSKELSEADIIISTHAILYKEKSVLSRLGLLIIDEEHRFGVEQRKALLELENSNTRPHLLNLTATPIPRSIALSLFGQMDVSVIEKPQTRKIVKTFVVPEVKRVSSISWLKEKLEDGGQIFWVCPLINESEIDEAIKSVENLYKEVQEIFSDFKVTFLHGKIKGDKKDKILEDFKTKKYQILIATTVIEVGIDIPNANIMIIENAEKYGLAQLHQLRGRVGRNDQEAWCLLYTKLETQENVSKRLNFFAKEDNGIKIAEFDLKTRGPGEVYGTIQAGLPDLKVANFGNMELMSITRDAALILEKNKSNE